VASLPNARLQVYFLENEDFFKRKQIFHDEEETWFDDNGLRTIFFCKGALETVKKFGWAPDVIHCSGWMTGLIPAYIKTAYKREPVFGNSKIVFTIGENTFEDNLGADFIKKALINANIKEKDLEAVKDATNTSLFRLGAIYADAITFGAEHPEKKLVDEFAKAKGKKIVTFKGFDTDLSEYMDLYNSLSS
jgi:starch synthase